MGDIYVGNELKTLPWMKLYTYSKICTSVLKAALFTTIKQKQSKSPTTDKGIKKKNVVYPNTEYYPAIKRYTLGFPGGAVVKNPPANAGDSGDRGSVPGWGISLGGGNDNSL